MKVGTLRLLGASIQTTTMSTTSNQSTRSGDFIASSQPWKSNQDLVGVTLANDRSAGGSPRRSLRLLIFPSNEYNLLTPMNKSSIRITCLMTTRHLHMP